MTTYEPIAGLPVLDDGQRIQARQNAKRNIVAKYAKKPRRADFDDYTVSRYPRWFTVLISSGLAFVALAAGVISAFRLYYAGYDQFFAAVPNQTQARIVGVLTPLAAEVLVIIAAVAMQLFLHQQGRAKLVALIPVATGTIVAFVGNWQIAQPDSTWGWVETVFPPVAVLSVAFFFELTLVPELERRQSNEAAYRQSRAEYDLLTSRPEAHERWQDTYGLALWEMWVRIYRGHVDLEGIDRSMRQLVAMREMEADTFFSAEFRLNSVNSGERQGETGGDLGHLIDRGPTTTPLKEQVHLILANHPELRDEKQADLAMRLGVGVGTVNEGFRLFQTNGKDFSDGHQ